MFRPHLSYIAAISVNRRTSGYPWRGGPVMSDFQWRLLYPVNLRCLARSGRWRQRSSKWLGMLVIMLWTRCQVLISHLHNSWILNHSSVILSELMWSILSNISVLFKSFGINCTLTATGLCCAQCRLPPGLNYLELSCMYTDIIFWMLSVLSSEHLHSYSILNAPRQPAQNQAYK